MSLTHSVFGRFDFMHKFKYTKIFYISNILFKAFNELFNDCLCALKSMNLVLDNFFKKNNK